MGEACNMHVRDEKSIYHNRGFHGGEDVDVGLVDCNAFSPEDEVSMFLRKAGPTSPH
jgi:hypothetical protein